MAGVNGGRCSQLRGDAWRRGRCWGDGGAWARMLGTGFVWWRAGYRHGPTPAASKAANTDNTPPPCSEARKARPWDTPREEDARRPADPTRAPPLMLRAQLTEAGILAREGEELSRLSSPYERAPAHGTAAVRWAGEIRRGGTGRGRARGCVVSNVCRSPSGASWGCRCRGGVTAARLELDDLGSAARGDIQL